ncbi:MAG: aspartate/glutamate racemase family protein [Planctomycetes bacterium]|nr:aspartate/glutamate racemase family protein [Planctomycetota bacterium]
MNATKHVALVHTVPSVYGSFPDRVRETLGADVRISNTLDDFLASDPAEKGEFTGNNLNRLLAILRCAERTGADIIVVTCSTLTPALETLRPLVATPILPIDGALLRQAVTMGTRIAILATARSAVEPTREGLRREAGRIGVEPDITVTVEDDAFTAIKRLDRETHDRLVLAAAAGIRDRDVIVLAQASMAHLEEAITQETGIPTLASPRLCLQALRDFYDDPSRAPR